jgi:parallel beta-helix repeat protein
VINGNKISFLIGGSRFSCYYNCEESGCYAALIIGENAVEIADGNDSMRMERVEWDVSAYKGKTAEIQLVDDSSNGHVSFDEVQFDVPPTITNLVTVRDGESIQSAIDRATPGDLIEVYSGTYRENINVNKKLDLYGVDMGEGNPVIDAQNLGSAITISADGVDLGWFNVTNSKLDAGIIVHSSWNSIHDIFAFNNSIGILLSQNSHNAINLTKIGGNIGGSAFGGLVIDNSSNNIVRGIDVSDNDVGISIKNSRNNEITYGSLDFGGFSVSEESYIKENKIGIQLFNSYYNSIRDLHIEKNGIGIILSNSYGNILNYNILGGNAATASDDGNNQWSDNFYGAIAGATFEQCGETYTYYIPDGSNVDKTAIKVYCPVAPAKSGKGASKKHENEHKK